MNKQINSFSITHLLLATHCQFHELIDAIISRYGAAVLHLEAIAPLYKTAVAAEKAAVNRPTSFSETPHMVSIDHKRDLDVSLCFNIINAYLKSAKVIEVDAAIRLHTLVAPYHGSQGHEYNRKTTEIDGLQAALATARPADVTMIGIGSSIKQMHTHNEAFKELMTERSCVVESQRNNSQERQHLLFDRFSP